MAQPSMCLLEKPNKKKIKNKNKKKTTAVVNIHTLLKVNSLYMSVLATDYMCINESIILDTGSYNIHKIHRDIVHSSYCYWSKSSPIFSCPVNCTDTFVMLKRIVGSKKMYAAQMRTGKGLFIVVLPI